jgi:hypothetical protein
MSRQEMQSQRRGLQHLVAAQRARLKAYHRPPVSDRFQRFSRTRIRQQLPRLCQVALDPIEIGIEGSGGEEDALGLAG